MFLLNSDFFTIYRTLWDQNLDDVEEFILNTCLNNMFSSDDKVNIVQS